MHRHLVCGALVLSLSGCGPSPVAHDPPPAEPGSSSLRFEEEAVVAFEDPVLCEDGVTAERSGSPTSIFCHVSAPDGSTIEVLLELGEALSGADGSVLSTQTEIELVRAGAGSTGREVGVTADTLSWEGTLTLTLGPEGSPRTAVLDGALSMASPPDIAMTFNRVPVTLD